MKVLTAFGTAGAGKSVGEDAAFEVRRKPGPRARCRPGIPFDVQARSDTTKFAEPCSPAREKRPQLPQKREDVCRFATGARKACPRGN